MGKGIRDDASTPIVHYAESFKNAVVTNGRKTDDERQVLPFMPLCLQQDKGHFRTIM